MARKIYKPYYNQPHGHIPVHMCSVHCNFQQWVRLHQRIGLNLCEGQCYWWWVVWQNNNLPVFVFMPLPFTCTRIEAREDEGRESALCPCTSLSLCLFVLCLICRSTIPCMHCCVYTNGANELFAVALYAYWTLITLFLFLSLPAMRYF